MKNDFDIFLVFGGVENNNQPKNNFRLTKVLSKFQKKDLRFLKA
jgi:hypothetical protein